MEKSYLFSHDKLSIVAQELNALKDKCSIYTFQGMLGAGKTTLIATMLKQRGITEPITSPTFTYVNVYENTTHETFYHFDLYRLSTLEEFIHAGFYEYLYQPESWVFVEWPTIIMTLLKQNVCHISLEYVDENTRKITYQAIF